MKFLMTLLSTVWIALLGTIAAQAETDNPAVTEMILGDVNAPIEIIEYASMTCPHCASFHSDVYPQLKENYIETGKVKFVFREVYFDKYGMWASMIARCAGPDRFFGVIDQMFDKQKTWSRAGNDLAIVTELSKIGKLSGLDDDQINACLQDADNLRSLVEWYKANMEQHKISGTPSFVIDGEMVSNRSYDELSALLDEKLGS
jgi:protein-disulfide isomerase